MKIFSFTISFVLGVLTPLFISIAEFLFSLKSCNLNLFSMTFWLLMAPSVLLILPTFYALFTSFLISMHKQYEFITTKFAIRKTLLNHALLVNL